MKGKPGYAPILLKIACSSTNKLEISQNAAIQLKNYINNFWKFGNNQQVNESLRFEEDEAIIIIPEEDKKVIRDNIIDALYQTKHKLVEKQINQCLKKLIRNDFPNNWSNVLEKLKELFESGDEEKIFVGIKVFNQFSKVYEFESGKTKAPYNAALEHLNNYFLKFLDILVPNIENDKSATIILKIIKIFAKSIQVNISPIFVNKENFDNWIKVILICADSKMPEDLTVKTTDPAKMEQNNKSIFWKLKFNAFTIILRVYQKYGFKDSMEYKKNKLFVKRISKHFTPVFFETCLNTLYKSSSQFISEKVLCLVFKVLSLTISREHMIEEFEKHLGRILKDYIIQNIFLTTSDIDCYNNVN
jgi:hypothetical protein